VKQRRIRATQFGQLLWRCLGFEVTEGSAQLPEWLFDTVNKEVVLPINFADRLSDEFVEKASTQNYITMLVEDLKPVLRHIEVLYRMGQREKARSMVRRLVRYHFPNKWFY
jgi:hypothetical protein